MIHRISRQYLVGFIVIVLFFVAFFIIPTQSASASECEQKLGGHCAPTCNENIYHDDGMGSDGCSSLLRCCIPKSTCSSVGGSCKMTCTPPDWVDYTQDNAYTGEAADVNASCSRPIDPYKCCLPGPGSETTFNCDAIDNPLLVPKCALQEAATLTGYVLEMVIVVGGILAVIFIIIGGYMIMTAQDDPNKMEKGRLTITWAIIGLTLAASAFVIMKLFSSLFNIDAFGSSNMRVYAQEDLPKATIQISGTLSDAQTGDAIKDADVYLYVDQDGKWVKWSGKDYGNQRNPQKLDVAGEYLFIVPPGRYYVRARSTGYYDAKSKPFETGEKPIRINLTMEKASELWQIVLASGVVLFIGGIAFIGIRSLIIWNKKRRIKMMVLKKVKEASQAQQKDLYPQDKVEK